jgi:16S rRNA processing protein RimM
MQLVTVGQIVNTFGVQGELKIVSFSHFSTKRYAPKKQVLLRNEATGQEQWATVIHHRAHKGLDIVQFEGIDSFNAKTYLNWHVLADKDAIKLPQDTYFYDDLVGSTVIDEAGVPHGQVSQVVDFGAHPILKITIDEDHKYQIPFVPFFILNVDIVAKTITVHFIEGLL